MIKGRLLATQVRDTWGGRWGLKDKAENDAHFKGFVNKALTVCFF